MIPPRYPEPNLPQIAEIYRQITMKTRGNVAEIGPLLAEARLRRIVDVCCGVGDLTVIYADSCQQTEVIGIDNDPKSLDIARRHFMRPNITYVEGNIYDLDYLGADFVQCSDALHHLDLLPAIKAMKKTLRPGGILGIRDFDRTHTFNGSLAEILPVMYKARKFGEYPFLCFLNQSGLLEDSCLPHLVSKMAAYTTAEVVTVLREEGMFAGETTNTTALGSEEVLMGIAVTKRD
ncbi:class I SAM-dependent methyltransferase [Candidatus Woesearchaeota archaeon]|jgi:ubiquinone/menaquinone biosynthesis C-methylase UbiE|nr:class I SAM-dependent methyltransferase [Candidatus Woesearchaeota archaeon]MBT4368303.1 class I SAM-dependent methyltransferase [Candidatus Woesearchaeota archaeon]MBT4712792.1 class I SAM-dependent methyltransferase [Candidatus Woesearchaeota archaeon]MBT6639704.1 class I SAM-dependent methyltransferase [Candidatus Woesearchaeota archaeon]MBT7133876.1 class I SAM-dependent methyltransferase [Candidatus Woesearchaeota archaeon]